MILEGITARELIGWITALVIGLAAIWREHIKNKPVEQRVQVEGAGVVLGGWETLYEAMRSQIDALTARVTQLEQQQAEDRQRYADAIIAIKQEHHQEIQRHVDEITGLRRMVAQQGISVLHALDDAEKGIGEAVGEATKRYRQEDEEDDEPVR